MKSIKSYSDKIYIKNDYSSNEIDHQEKSKTDQLPLDIKINELVHTYFVNDNDVIGCGTSKQILRLTALSKEKSPSLALAIPFRNKVPKDATQKDWDVFLDYFIDHESYISSLLKEVPQVIQVCTISYKGKKANVMELCEKGDLDKASDDINKLSEVKRMQIALQIALGLHEMHKRKICHLDLKEKNIFLRDDYTPLIGDLERAKSVGKETEICSTYPAPEMVSECCKEENKKRTVVCLSHDLWGYGEILNKLKNGKSLLKNLLHTKVQFNNGGKAFKMEISKLQGSLKKLNKSEDRIDRLVAQLLSTNPQLRPSAEECVKTIQTWILENSKEYVN